MSFSAADLLEMTKGKPAHGAVLAQINRGANTRLNTEGDK